MDGGSTPLRSIGRTVVRKRILTFSGVVLFLSSISVYGGQTIDTDCIQKSVDDNPTVELEDLVRRDELYFRKFSVCPFTGWVKQETVRGWIRDGKRDGEWFNFWDNGQLINRGLWLSGLRQGPWVGYFPDGKLHHKGSYSNGKRQGPWVSYFSNGKLHHNGSYLNGKRHGSWIIYYEVESGVTTSGESIVFSISEHDYQFVGQYDNGKMVGQWTHYWENGQEKSQGTYNLNIKNGLWVYYFDNGQVKKKGSYKNGTQDGPWFHYTESGDLLRKNIWKDGYIVEEVEG